MQYFWKAGGPYPESFANDRFQLYSLPGIYHSAHGFIVNQKWKKPAGW